MIYPIPSLYGIFTYILVDVYVYLFLMVNVGKYTRPHGCYGVWKKENFLTQIVYQLRGWSWRDDRLKDVFFSKMSHLDTLQSVHI